MNEIVKYNNYMNNLKFSGFTTIDYNFLMVLCNKLRNKETKELIISFEELREKTGYTQHSDNQFISDLMRMNNKLMKMNCAFQKDGVIFQFVLFSTFLIDTVNKKLIVDVNERCQFILNDIAKNFTKIELNEFVKLESRYSKSLYRLLKQFKCDGKYDVSVEDFRERMDCPKSYTNKHIMDKIIKPSLNELKNKNCFQNLKCKPKYSHRRGNPILGYIFTFESNEIEKKGKRTNQASSDGNEKHVNDFCNCPQRTYDHEEIEKGLLNRSIPKESNADHYFDDFLKGKLREILKEIL